MCERGYAEFAKKNVGHLFIVVLSRVNQTERQCRAVPIPLTVVCLNTLDQGRDFHKVGTRARDDK